MMTDQEIFDRVWHHLNKQRVASVMEHMGHMEHMGTQMCAYRGPKGRMCAIGCLIPDEIYHPEMECKRVQALLDDFIEIRDLFFTPEEVQAGTRAFKQRAVFLDRLQEAHDLKLDSPRGDEEENFRQWRIEMGAIADKHGLTIPETTKE